MQLGHGSGGKLSAALLRNRFLPHLANPVLRRLGDAATVPAGGAELAISTDTFVVHPLEFPGGNIGSLAVHGTVNDLAMMGARPRYLTAGFVLEEGLAFDVLDRIVATMARAAADAGVPVVAGDTKVVERGKADGMFLNTTGVGVLTPGFRPSPERAEPGDVVLVSGPIGRHGIAIMAAREGLVTEAQLTSDTANEGVLLAIVAPGEADRALAALRSLPLGAMAARLGRVVGDHPGLVALQAAIGTSRVVDLLPGDQLPRIC